MSFRQLHDTLFLGATKQTQTSDGIPLRAYRALLALRSQSEFRHRGGDGGRTLGYIHPSEGSKLLSQNSQNLDMGIVD